MVCIRIEPQIDSDVIIVGAGPAGATAATYIARAGLKVILVERQKFPRDKVCGDFLGPAALVELKMLGITDLPQYRRTNIIRRAALYLDGKQLISSSIPDVEGLPPYGRVIPRMKLDEWIFDAAREAGAYTLDGFYSIRFETHNDSITVIVEGPNGVRNLRTRLLIGADGSSSIISSLLRNQPSPSTARIIAVRAYFEDVDGPPEQAELYFTSESFPGYCWLFPTSWNSANVGVGMVSNTIPRMTVHLRELLVQIIEKDAALRRRLHQARMVGKIVSWPLMTYNPRLPIVSDRIMLVGDAAGLINPLNGEGIQYALLSGRWAAGIAVSCAAQNDFSQVALSTYSARIEKMLRCNMALSSLIVQFIRNRTLNPIWLYALKIIVARAQIDPDYAQITGGILAGVAPAIDALSFKTISGTLEQAAISTGFRSIIHILRGPRHLTKVGMDSAHAGFEMAYHTMQHPVDLLKWSAGLATSVAELASQVAKDVSKPAKENVTAVNLLVN